MPRTFENTLEARSAASYVVSDGDVFERSVQLRRLLRRTIRLSIQSLIFVALLAAFFFRIPGVEGRSMQPNIEGGNHVLINTLAYRMAVGPLALVDHPVMRCDIVAFARDDGDERKIFLKRVIALPGESVAVVDGSVTVNGRPLKEAYNPIPDRSNMPALTVPAGNVFVLGDNRAESDDSRHFGAIPQSSIIGKAFLIIWPLGHVQRIR